MNERNGISIHVQILNPEDFIHDAPVLTPGSIVEGRVEIRTEKEFTCRGVTLEVGWHTEGRGNKDEEIIGSHDIDKTEFKPGAPFVEEFQVQLPATPYSFAGELINVKWTFKAGIDFPMWLDLSDEAEFILRPAPEKASSST